MDPTVPGGEIHLVRHEVAISLAGTLPAEADGIAHHGPTVAFAQETADLILYLAKELTVLRHQDPQLISSNSSLGPEQSPTVLWNDSFCHCQPRCSWSEPGRPARLDGDRTATGVRSARRAALARLFRPTRSSRRSVHDLVPYVPRRRSSRTYRDTRVCG
jgi:hypothetical protein